MSDHLLPYLVNCSLMFTEEPLLQRPAAARAAGFGAVEFWWPFPTPVPADREVDAFAAAIEEAGVTLAGLNFFAGDLAGRGYRGWVSLEYKPTGTTEASLAWLPRERRAGTTGKEHS